MKLSQMFVEGHVPRKIFFWGHVPVFFGMGGGGGLSLVPPLFRGLVPEKHIEDMSI